MNWRIKSTLYKNISLLFSLYRVIIINEKRGDVMYIDKKEVGERILKIRKSYGYSMKEFGEAVGHAPKGSVNSWEKGVNLPNEERLKQIASMGNMSVNELLYGSFKEYVEKLVRDRLGIQLTDRFLSLFYQAMQQSGFTYGDDVEIVRFLNGLLTYHNVATRETAIFYQAAADAGGYYDGIIQKEDYAVLVCHAYADKQANTLHIMPAYERIQEEEHNNFLRTMDELAVPHKHNYFTSGFLTLGLALRDSRIICYRIDENSHTAKVTPYGYDCESDSFKPDKTLEYKKNRYFGREIAKEEMFRKFCSKDNSR